MKIVRREKKNKRHNQRLELKKKTYNPWKVRSKKYSEYPYVVTVSFFRKNVFLSASDLRGRIKFWTNAGRLGFKGADKTQYMAVVTVAEKFFKKLVRYGIRDVFLKFKNYKRSRNAIKRAIKKLKLTGKKTRWKKFKLGGKTKNQKLYGTRQVRFLGIWTELHISFNGCRKKKERRKRQRRNTKRISLR